MPGEVVKLDRIFLVIMCADCDLVMTYEEDRGSCRCYQCGNILATDQWQKLMAAKREIEQTK